MQITGGDERWENWMQYVQTRMVPKFTDLGFAVIRTPPSVHAKLREAIRDELERLDEIPIEEVEKRIRCMIYVRVARISNKTDSGQ
jgi:hypothetical protein